MSENTPLDGDQGSGPEPFTFNEDGTVNIPDVGSVSVEELGKGYLRQSDYTRKTQDLALQRSDLESAKQLYDQIQANPHGILPALAENLGVKLPQAPAPKQTDPQGDGWDDGGWGDDVKPSAPQENPVETQMMGMLTQLQAQINDLRTGQTRTAVEQELDQAVASLTEVGIQVEDPQAILRFAHAKAMTSLDDAAKLMYADDIVEARVAAATKDENIVQQKREASQAVTPGTGAAGENPQPAGDNGEGLDLRAAMEAALNEHGVSDIRDVTFDTEVRSSY